MLFFPLLSYATDYTHFLSYGEIKVTNELTSDSFLGEDQYGRKHSLKIYSLSERTARVRQSILLDAMGLPNIPAYPTYIETRSGRHKALVQSVTQAKPFRFTPQHPPSFEQMEEIVGHLILQAVIGNTDTSLSHFESINGHLVYPNPDPFEIKSYDPKNVEKALSKIPDEWWKFWVDSNPKELFPMIREHIFRLKHALSYADLPAGELIVQDTITASVDGF